MHHYTVHESCFDALCIVRIRLLAIVIIILRFYIPALMIMGGIMESRDPSGVQKHSFVSFLKELGNKQNATLQSYPP